MRKLILVVWLLVPLAVAAFHFGPGQDLQREDRAGAALARAERAAARARTVAAQEGDAAAREHWAEAVVAYGEALEHLPDGHVREARQFRLERAKAMMYVSQLPDARRELETLLEEVSADAERDEAVLADARTALASAHYYTTWLMRLEGLTREAWQPEIEAARQLYRLNAEAATEKGDALAAEASRKDLEAAIRLERMELTELQGLPLPSQ